MGQESQQMSPESLQAVSKAKTTKADKMFPTELG